MSRINVRPRNGRHQVSFYYDDPTTGKRCRVQRTSPHPQKGKSYDWGMALKAELEAPPAPPQRERITLAQLWERYQETALLKLKPSSQVTHRCTVGSTILPELGALCLDEITTYEIERYAAARQALGLSNASLRREIGTLSMLLATAVRWGMLDQAPTVKLPRAAPPQERYLTPDEAAQLIAAAREDDIMDTLIPALLYTGMRVGEALALRWECVDMVRGQIEIRANLSAGQTTTPKSGKARRVPLSPEGLAIFKQRWDAREPGPLVWPHKGGQMSYQSLRWRWVKLLERLNIGELRMHDLRHTYASWLVQSGVSIQVVSHLLGHATIQVTMRYAHLAPETLHNAVAHLDSFGDRLVTRGHLSIVRPAK